MSLTLFVGSNNPNLAEAAYLADPTAYLIDKTNQHQNHSGVCYTSISDLSTIGDFAFILRQADRIIYVPNPSWLPGEKIKKYSERYWVEHYLCIFSLDPTKKIINSPPYSAINRDYMLTLNAQRKNNDPHLWVSGCSTSAGVGVATHERYANLVAEKLNLPMCMLAKTSTSVSYAADQILRSDIRENDLVILGVTNHQRKTYYDEENSKIISVVITNIKEQNRKIDLTDPTLLYDSVIAVQQVINFCKKVNAKLVILGIHVDTKFAVYLKDFASYVHANGFWGVNPDDQFLDIGTDNMHAGPLMHKFYAEKIIDKLKEIY